MGTAATPLRRPVIDRREPSGPRTSRTWHHAGVANEHDDTQQAEVADQVAAPEDDQNDNTDVTDAAVVDGPTTDGEPADGPTMDEEPSGSTVAEDPAVEEASEDLGEPDPVEAQLAPQAHADLPIPQSASLQKAFMATCSAVLRTYNGWRCSGDPGDLSKPVLFVTHHGFGTFGDPAIFATAASLGSLDLIRPFVAMSHDINWQIGMGGLVESLGGIPATRDGFRDAITQGYHVLVFPGGDMDVAKPWTQRNVVDFHGRSGFARMAMDSDMAIVPIVTAGAAEGAFVFTNGAGIAKTLRLKKFLRMSVAPVSWSLPWGFSVGGLLPYASMPTRLESRVLPQMKAEPGDTPADFALRVQTQMQLAMNDLARHRGPLLGWPRRG